MKSNEVEFRELLLEKVAAGSSLRLNRAVLHNADLRILADETRDQLVAGLHAYVLAEHFADDRYFDSKAVPASWRDARRAARLVSPKRRVRWLHWRDVRKPVALRTLEFAVSVRTYKSYPEARVGATPDLGPVRILQMPSISAARYIDEPWEPAPGK